MFHRDFREVHEDDGHIGGGKSTMPVTFANRSTSEKYGLRRYLRLRSLLTSALPNEEELWERQAFGLLHTLLGILIL